MGSEGPPPQQDREDDVIDQSTGEPGEAARRGSRTRPGVIVRWLRHLLALGAAGLLIASLLPLLHPLWPLASIAEHFALQILLAAALLSLLALALRRWRWLAAILGIALVQAWIIHPHWPLPGLVMTPAAEERRLKIVSLNVWYRGESYQAVREYLAASGADVIGLVEVTPRWKAELASLRELYPYAIDCIGADLRCEEMLLSRHPFTRSGAARVDGALPVLAWGEIALPGHGPVTVAVTHLVWPLLPAGEGAVVGPLPRLAQTEQAAQLVAGLARLPTDLILMGDFNAAPWSRIQQALRAASGLENDFAAPSWPAWGAAAIRLPIDHILARGRAQIHAFQAGPDVGSDHLPVEAVVSLAP